MLVEFVCFAACIALFLPVGGAENGAINPTKYKNPYAEYDNPECKDTSVSLPLEVPNKQLSSPCAGSQASQFGCLSDFSCDPAYGLADAGEWFWTNGQAIAVIARSDAYM